MPSMEVEPIDFPIKLQIIGGSGWALTGWPCFLTELRKVDRALAAHLFLHPLGHFLFNARRTSATTVTTELSLISGWQGRS